MHLWLIRHAKSSWSSGARGDFDRPLNARGERDGPRMQAWLAKQPLPIEWLWSSDAVRARATADYVAGAFPDAVLQLDHRLYGAAPETLVQVAQETPNTVETAAIIAHNPGITWCVNLLAGERVTDNLPTFGAALLQWDGGPDALAPGAASLEILSSPKTLPPTFFPARQPLP